MLAPPRLRHKTKVLRNVSLVCAVAVNCVMGSRGLPLPCRDAKQQFCVASMVGMSAESLCSKVSVSHTMHVLLCHTHSRHVCCVMQQTCLLCDTEDMSAV